MDRRATSRTCSKACCSRSSAPGIPAAIPPEVTLRGFSWIVSPDEGGVLVHLEMQIGTVSAGPFAIDEARLTDMISRVMGGPKVSTLVH